MKKEIIREISYELVVTIDYIDKETGKVPDETIYTFNITRRYAEGIFDQYEDDAEVYVDNQLGKIVHIDGTEGEEEEEALREMMKEILEA